MGAVGGPGELGDDVVLAAGAGAEFEDDCFGVGVGVGGGVAAAAGGSAGECLNSTVQSKSPRLRALVVGFLWPTCLRRWFSPEVMSAA